MTATSSERKTFYILILILILLSEGAFVLVTLIAKPYEFIRYLGFASGQTGTISAWLLAALVAIAYVWSAAKIADVRRHLIRASLLKGIAVVAAVMAAILEEMIFRRWVMDYLHHGG